MNSDRQAAKPLPSARNVQAWLTDMAAGIERDARDARIVRPNDEKRVLRVEARPA